MTDKTIPFSLKDAPSLIEHVLPVQRLSIDVFKERMAGSGQTLTALGSYWKGRKPLVLNRACILGSLLPVTENIKKDLEIFELLMSMDEESMRKRLGLKDGVPLPASPYKELATKAKRAEETTRRAPVYKGLSWVSALITREPKQDLKLTKSQLLRLKVRFSLLSVT